MPHHKETDTQRTNKIKECEIRQNTINFKWYLKDTIWGNYAFWILSFVGAKSFVGLNLVDYKILLEKMKKEVNIIRGVILKIFMQSAFFWVFFKED